MNLWTVASARDARYGLRGVRVGEANNPGPRRLCRQRLASSSEDEFLFRPTEGQDVIPRMESRIESSSNRFAALADAETVPAGSQELEDVRVIRERSSIVVDCDRVPETIFDAFEEDLEQPSRRLVLVGGGCQTPLAAEDTQRESDTQFSIPHQTGVTFVDMTTTDSDAENPTKQRNRRRTCQQEELVKGRICRHRTRRALMGFQMRKVRTFVSQWHRPNQLGWISEADRWFGRSRCMQSRWFRGAFRSALRLAMQESVDGGRSEDLVRCARAWKLFRTKLEERFRQFQSGDWTSLLLETAAVSAEAHSRSVRRTRRDTKDNEAKRVARAMARQALDRVEVAPGPRVFRQPINEDIMRMDPGEQFQLDPDECLIGLQKVRRGAAVGPSVRGDSLKVKDSDLLVQVGALQSIGNVPESILKAIRLGRIAALCKPDGGVRGIVVEDILRRRRGWWNRVLFTLKFGLASTVQRGTSSNPAWPPRFCTIHSSPDVQGHQVRRAAVPPLALPPPPIAPLPPCAPADVAAN